MVTNPLTRDWSVIASLFATLNDMFGNRMVCGIGRGDSSRRVIGPQPAPLAPPGGGGRGVDGSARRAAPPDPAGGPRGGPGAAPRAAARSRAGVPLGAPAPAYVGT